MVDVEKPIKLSLTIAALAGIAGTLIGGGITFAHVDSQYSGLPAKVVLLTSRLETLKDSVAVLNDTPSQSQLSWQGEWVGKWNGTWNVVFKIFYTYGNTYLVDYSHQMVTNGPMEDDGIMIGHLDGHELVWGKDLFLREDRSNNVEALGVFEQNTSVVAPLSKIADDTD